MTNWADAVSALDLGAERTPTWVCERCEREVDYYPLDGLCEDCREEIETEELEDNDASR